MSGVFCFVFVNKVHFMTASQSLKIYEVLNKHFKNPEDAKLVVEQIEQMLKKKATSKKDYCSKR